MLIVPVAAISPDTGPKLRMMISSSDKDIHIPYVEIPAQKFKAFAAGRPDLIEAPDVEPENQVSAEPALNNPSLEARSADFETLSCDHMMFQSYLELSIKMLTETLVKTDDSMSNGSFRGLGSL